MADRNSNFNSALEGSLLELERLGMSRVLRTEQVKAISTLTSGEDLLAVLPTGFGKSLIFQLLVRVVECLTGKASCVLVVCPLKSIIQDQSAEATSLGLKAVALGNCRLDDISSGKYQISYGSAQGILSKPFLSCLKKTDSPFHQQLCAIVVDESHTVETWTGQRFVYFGLCSVKRRV